MDKVKNNEDVPCVFNWVLGLLCIFMFGLLMFQGNVERDRWVYMLAKLRDVQEIQRNYQDILVHHKLGKFTEQGTFIILKND